MHIRGLRPPVRSDNRSELIARCACVDAIRMDERSILSRGMSLHALLVAIIVGVNAALPIYLWQASVEVAIAAFVIVGYTAWLWAATRYAIDENEQHRDALRRLPANSPVHRVGRLLIDPGFWWSIIFGCATVTGGVWYAGMREMTTLIGIGSVWAVIAASLNYGLTLNQPTTRCRRCKYQLAGHIDHSNPAQRITCPECGSRWSQQQLCLSSPPAPVKKAA